MQAITGEDLASTWRSRYSTAAQALREMSARGGLVILASSALGDPVPSAQARRGDVVLRCGEHGPSLGICLGARCAFTGLGGLVFLDLKECEQAWRV